MDIKLTLDEEAGCLEFIAYYEKKLSEYMDPFRRCRSGQFDAKDLEPCVRETYLTSMCAKRDNEVVFEQTISEKIDILLRKTNDLLDLYYRQTTKEISIAPDVLAHKAEIEKWLKEHIEKKLALTY